MRPPRGVWGRVDHASMYARFGPQTDRTARRLDNALNFAWCAEQYAPIEALHAFAGGYGSAHAICDNRADDVAPGLWSDGRAAAAVRLRRRAVKEQAKTNLRGRARAMRHWWGWPPGVSQFEEFSDVMDLGDVLEWSSDPWGMPVCGDVYDDGALRSRVGDVAPLQRSRLRYRVQKIATAGPGTGSTLRRVALTVDLMLRSNCCAPTPLMVCVAVDDGFRDDGEWDVELAALRLRALRDYCTLRKRRLHRMRTRAVAAQDKTALGRPRKWHAHAEREWDLFHDGARKRARTRLPPLEVD